MLADLDPNDEVPDSLYLASLDHAVTPEEVAFRDLLVFHRDCLNGGLDQALDNRAGEPLAPYLAAYRAVGLISVAGLIADAAAHAGKAIRLWGWEAKWEAMIDRYQRLIYGLNGDQPDAIEAAAVRFAQQHEAAFSNVVGAAKRGDFRQFNFGDGA
jgi:hypothetical protein